MTMTEMRSPVDTKLSATPSSNCFVPAPVVSSDLELMTKPLARVQRKQNVGTVAGRHIAALTIVAAGALLAMLGGVVLYAQGRDEDKYSLRSPGGICE
jgi:hypothetical protein